MQLLVLADCELVVRGNIDLQDGAPAFEAFTCLWAVGMYVFSREITTAIARHVQLIHTTERKGTGKYHVASFDVPPMETQLAYENLHTAMEVEPVDAAPDKNPEDLTNLVSSEFKYHSGAVESEMSRKDRAEHNKAAAEAAMEAAMEEKMGEGEYPPRPPSALKHATGMVTHGRGPGDPRFEAAQPYGTEHLTESRDEERSRQKGDDEKVVTPKTSMSEFIHNT